MADYYSILSKAVSALEPNTASARQRLYERARSAISAEMEGAASPFDASDIAAAKQGLKSAIERVEAEALPAWVQHSQRAVRADDSPATTDLLPDQVAYRFLDASEIAAATQGLERAIENIEAETIPGDRPTTAEPPAEIEEASRPLEAAEVAAAEQGHDSAIEDIGAEAIPDWPQQSEGAEGANDCPPVLELPVEIEGGCPEGSDIAAAMQRLESAIERIRAEVIPACLAQGAVCAKDRRTEPRAEIGAVPHDDRDVAKQRSGSAIERIEPDDVPDWLLHSEREVRAADCPATAANQNEDNPGPLKRLWTRVTGLAAGSGSSSSGQDTWLSDLLERAEADDNDEQDFAPKRAARSL